MRKKTIYLVILNLWLVTLFSGCNRLSQELQLTKENNFRINETVVDYTPPSLTDTPREIQTLPPTRTIENGDSIFLDTNCVEMVEEAPESLKLFGKLVLDDGLFDLSDYEFIPFDTNDFDHTCCVTPDRNRLALYSTDNDRISIVDSQGNFTSEFVNLSLVPIYWLDNHQLVLEKQPWPLMVDGDPIYPNYGEHSFILDTLNGSLTELALDFRDLAVVSDSFGRFWDYASVTRTSINPTASYLVYPAEIIENHQFVSHEIVLWGIQEEREIFRLSAFWSLSLPSWNSTGDEFLTSAPPEYSESESGVWTSNGNELFAVGVAGTLRRLTYMTAVAPVFQYDYIWSPNDEKVAFRLQYMDEGIWGLPDDYSSIAVLDIASEHVDNLCIEALYRPVWSPDGRYIAITGRNESEDNQQYELIIIDLLQNKAYKLLEQGYLYIQGWMN